MNDVFDMKATIDRIKGRGFTFAMIARLSGLDQQTIRNVWHGRNSPTMATAKRLAALETLTADFTAKAEAIQKL